MVPMSVGQKNGDRGEVSLGDAVNDELTISPWIDDPGTGGLFITHDVTVRLVGPHHKSFHNHFLLLVGIADGSRPSSDIHSIKFLNSFLTVLFTHADERVLVMDTDAVNVISLDTKLCL